MSLLLSKQIPAIQGSRDLGDCDMGVSWKAASFLSVFDVRNLPGGAFAYRQDSERGVVPPTPTSIREAE